MPLDLLERWTNAVRRFGVLAAALSGVVSGSATAAEFSALLGTRLDPACQAETCQHIVLEKVEQVAASDGGAGKLYVVVLKDASSRLNDADPMKNGTPGVAFVFCSRTRPSVFYPATDGSPTWTAAYLRPNIGDDVSDATAASYLVYFASCHRTAPSGAEEIVALAKRLGYRVKPNEPAADATVPSPFAVIAKEPH